MQTSEFGVLVSTSTVDATLFGSKVTSESNQIPAPMPKMKAPAINDFVMLERPLLLFGGGGVKDGSPLGGRRGGGGVD